MTTRLSAAITFVILASLTPSRPAFAQFVQQGPKLVGTGAAGMAHQGESVALSFDGSTAIVGGPWDRSVGAAWVWARSGGGWIQQGPKLAGSGAIVEFGTPSQGHSVSLSADGNTAIVGGPDDGRTANNDGVGAAVGAAWVWTRNGDIWTQQTKLVGSGAVGVAGQGVAVSLSADGNTAVVGGPGDDGGAGAVWIWTRSAGVWTQQSKLVGVGAAGKAHQGCSVSLSADGNTAIVGGNSDERDPGAPPYRAGRGAAWIWSRSGGVWTQQGAKLVGSGVIVDSYGSAQGNSVSLSADGNTAIVAAPADNNLKGAVWIWTRSAGVWTQQGGKLADADAKHTRQGLSVSLSADGNTAIVGGMGDKLNNGGVLVWIRRDGVWSEQAAGLAASDAEVLGSGQDYRASISADGNTAVVTSPSDNCGAGASWIWTRSGGVWTQQSARLLGSGAEGPARRGGSVALSADGNTALVGGSNDNGFWSDGPAHGAVWVWTRDAGVWTQQGNKLVGSGAVGPYIEQGRSVALSADGNTAIVGGWQDSGLTGAAWVWTRSGGVWTQQGPKLVGSDADGPAAQGRSVALSADGNTAIVGGSDDSRLKGAAWVWTRSGGVWTQQGPKLVAPAGSSVRGQGAYVALSGDGQTAIIGAAEDVSGSAWVWTRRGGVWTQQGSKLESSGTAGNGLLTGNPVALSANGNTALIGENAYDTVGGVWVWTRSGGVWTQQSNKLVSGYSLDPASQGCSVALSADGNTAIVGGQQDSGGAGATWVWRRKSGGIWIEFTKLFGAGGDSPSFQGFAVAISADGNTAIIGGPGDHNEDGAAWVFVSTTDNATPQRRRASRP
jgi:hypothetical protein